MHVIIMRMCMMLLQLMDEFLTAVKRRFGNTTLVQFEDMAYDNTSKLLNMYRTGKLRSLYHHI